MADDRPEDRNPGPGDAPGRPDDAARRPDPDETAAHEPFVDDHTAEHPAMGHPAIDETQRHEPYRGDETQQHRPPAGDETERHQPYQGDDETARHYPYGGDETARYQPQGAGAWAGAGDRPTDPNATRVQGPGERAPNWSARAPVPPPGAGGPVVERRQWVEREPAPPPPERRWWVPALIALVALILLAVLGYGLWLLLGDGDNSSPAPTAPPATATGPVAPETTLPPTEAPTAPTATTEAGVVVPRLLGLSESDARATLEDVGLRVRVVRQQNAAFPPGSVIGVDPPSGTILPRDTRVTLIVATAPPSTQAPPPSTAPPTTAGPTATATR